MRVPIIIFEHALTPKKISGYCVFFIIQINNTIIEVMKTRVNVSWKKDILGTLNTPLNIVFDVKMPN